MEDTSNFDSIVDRFESMTQHRIPTNSTPLVLPPATAGSTTSTPSSLIPHESLPVKLKSIEDFDAEQAALRLMGGGGPLKKPNSPSEPPRRIPKPVIEPNRKKPKKETDVEELDAEERAVKEMGNANWVGRLQIYRDAHPIPGPGTGIDWTESVEVNPLPRFSCVLVLYETLNRFGYETINNTTKIVSFSNKKTAKQFAAKKAIDWLITNEYMPRDGAARHKSVPVPLPKKVKIPPPKPKIKSATTGPNVVPILDYSPGPAPPSPTAQSPPSQTTYAARIPELCHALGINIPTYKYVQATPGSPLCDAYADFGGDATIDGKVGEVTNVFGKKNAKEAVARIAYAFLRDIERQRVEAAERERGERDFICFSDGEADGDEDEEVRKRKREATSGSPEVESKVIKVEA